MNTFIAFSTERKNMITRTKGLLTNPDNLAVQRNMYGNRIKNLFFIDYVIYAVLRGADYKKTSHMPLGDNATLALKGVLDSFDVPNSQWLKRTVARYAENEAEIYELKQLIEQAI